jgi:tetratricopeptide (TPR) repeat protein
MNEASHPKPRLLNERNLVVVIVLLIGSVWLSIFGAIFAGRHIAMCMMEMPGSCESALQSVFAKGQVRQPLVIAQANNLVADEQPDKAIELVRAEIAAGLRNKSILHFLSNLQKQSEDKSAAIKSLNEAFELDPNDKDILSDLILVLQETRDYEGARKVTNQFITSNPSDAWGYSWLSWVERMSDRYDAALAASDKAIEFDTGNAEHYRDRAFALLNLERTEESATAFSKAISIDPENSSYRSERASAYVKLGKFEQARSDFRALVDLSQDVSSRLQYANFEFGRSNLKVALLQTEEALKIEADNEEALALRIRILIDSRELDAAQSALEKFEVDFQKNSESVQLRAELLDERGEDAKALELYKSLLGEWENYAWLRVQIGHVYIDLKTPEQSLTWFEQALKISPTENSAYGGLARGHIHLKQWDKAMDAAQKMIEREPFGATSFARRGQVNQGLGKHDLAIADFKHALELDDSIEWVKTDLALLEHQLKSKQHIVNP